MVLESGVYGELLQNEARIRGSMRTGFQRGALTLRGIFIICTRTLEAS